MAHFYKSSLLALLFFGFIQSFGQPLTPSGSIKGLIKTSDGKPAPYVNVLLKEANRGTTTVEDGSYHFKNVREGVYTIVTSFVGLQTQEQQVTVTSGQIAFVNFTLSEDAEHLQEITISDSRSLNEKTPAIGKGMIKPMDLPQSTVTIDRAVIERQQALRLSDVLMNANGVYVMGASGGTQEELAGRGFSFGSNNTFKNGVRFNNGVMPEVSSLERVEILKGSNAILFGNVAAGGVLNLVTKKPKFENGGELSFRTGSYDFYKPSLDIYGSLHNSGKVAYRINTSYENSASFRDQVVADRIYFNPSFLVRAGKKTEILLEADYLHDNRTLDYGTGAIDYQIIDLPRNRFIGASWSYFNAKQKSSTLTITHQLSEAWQLRTVVAYQGYEAGQYGTTRPNSTVVTQTTTGQVQADGTWVRGLQRTGNKQQYYLGEFNAIGKFNTGALEHQILFGADIDRFSNQNLAYVYRNASANNRNIYDTINVFDLTLRKQRHDIPDIARNTLTKNPIDRVGVFVQDLVSINPRVKVLAGLRYSYIESVSTVFTYKPGETTPTAGTPTSYYDDAFTPRFGLVYQPIKDISIFASYANSFNLNTARDTTGAVLPPSLVDQFELGAKSDLFKGLLSVNVTVYQIVNSNSPQPLVPANPNFPTAQELAGQITSKGVELDIMTKSVRGFSFLAGYSYNDTRYTKSKQFIVNSRLRYNPAHTANASVYYTFSQGWPSNLNLGFTAFYMGDRVAGRSTQVNVPNDTRKLMPVPNFFQFDASAGYTFSNISVRIKISNLLNELSYNVHDDNSVNPIAPRQFSATVAYKL